MNDQGRRQRGEALFKEVYGGVVNPLPPEQRDKFYDFTIDYLFAEVWGKSSMSIRDKRLVAMGLMAALGETETFEIQLRVALKNGELTREQVDDLLIFLTQYVGFPRTTKLLMAARKILAETA